MSSSVFPWQKSLWKFIFERYQQKRLPSAFLFEGAKGIGKTDFSRALAALLLCQSNEQDKHCEKCDACHLLKSGTHPDFICIAGEGSSKTIKIDQIRALNEEIFKTAYFQKGYRVVIIEAAHHLNIAAANALLKTLEESPLKVFFMLLTDSPYRISMTIRSRCERMKFSKPPTALAESWLKNQLSPEVMEQYSIEFLLRLTHNSPLEAQSLIENKTLHWRESLMHDFSSVMLGSIDPLSLAEKYKVLETEVLFFWIKSIVVDLIRLKIGAKERMIHIDKYTLLTDCISRISVVNLFNYLDNLYRLEAQVSTFNLNGLLVVDEIFCGILDGY